MEYCSGGSVSDIMAASDAPLDEDLIAYVCRETLAGLVYLHSLGKVRGLQIGLLLPTRETKCCYEQAVRHRSCFRTTANDCSVEHESRLM